ncbi:hypothetical protein NL676_039093 [Syzygium grande]|nr:hypothetical protein NL676_039093 [Syzygium grande]
MAPNNVDNAKDNLSAIGQVRLTMTNTDDSTLPMWTFRISPCGGDPPHPGGSWRPWRPTAQFGSRARAEDVLTQPASFNMKKHVLNSIFTKAGARSGRARPTP